MNRPTVVLILLITITVFFVGCPNNKSRKATPTPVTITFPGGVKCSSKTLSIDFDASIVTEQASGSPELIVKVCITCSGTGLDGISGITGKVAKDIEEIPINLRGVQSFPKTSNGCTVKKFRQVPGGLAGKHFTVTVIDSSGKTVDKKDVEIKDNR